MSQMKTRNNLLWTPKPSGKPPPSDPDVMIRIVELEREPKAQGMRVRGPARPHGRAEGVGQMYCIVTKQLSLKFNAVQQLNAEIWLRLPCKTSNTFIWLPTNTSNAYNKKSNIWLNLKLWNDVVSSRQYDVAVCVRLIKDMVKIKKFFFYVYGRIVTNWSNWYQSEGTILWPLGQHRKKFKQNLEENK